MAFALLLFCHHTKQNPYFYGCDSIKRSLRDNYSKLNKKYHFHHVSWADHRHPYKTGHQTDLSQLGYGEFSCRSGEIGRRTGFKIQRGQPHVGSIPTFGTTERTKGKRVRH